MDDLTSNELLQLVRRVFEPRAEDRALAVLIDLPPDESGDRQEWRRRRAMASRWARQLADVRDELGLDVAVVLYPSVGRNNADLPERAWIHGGGALPVSARELTGTGEPFDNILARHQLLLAPTEYSATAPLKVAARRHGFRAATMPGFSREMVPALRLDYREVNRRVLLLKDLLDRAHEAVLSFGAAGGRDYLTLDLRHRTAHASGGVLTEPGVAGNLPSGETYIVPYEGELAGDPSRSQGVLPVQLEGEVVRYRIAGNRAVEVISEGEVSRREAELIVREPAYANLAELGLGVLAELGVEPVGEILLDEKLALHIAFGRSDHFGGAVGPADFSAPDAVTHQDRVYLRQLQPDVRVSSLDLRFPDGSNVAVIRDDRYVVDFGRA